MSSLAGKRGDTFCSLLKEKSVTPHDLVNVSKNILIGISYYLILNTQKNHIFNVFFAYVLLQFETKKFGLKNPESAAKQLKRRKYQFLISYFMQSTQIFKRFYA